MDNRLATIALTAFRQRQAIARKQTAAGRVAMADAERLLRPWAAIACLTGADVSELADDLAWYRSAGISEASARAIVADDLCPRERWVPALAAARDKAVARAEAMPAGSARETALADARALIRLADHFTRDINGRHAVPPLTMPQPQRTAA